MHYIRDIAKRHPIKKQEDLTEGIFSLVMAGAGIEVHGGGAFAKPQPARVSANQSGLTIRVNLLFFLPWANIHLPWSSLEYVKEHYDRWVLFFPGFRNMYIYKDLDTGLYIGFPKNVNDLCLRHMKTESEKTKTPTV